MPTTDAEAQEFAANVADPVRLLRLNGVSTPGLNVPVIEKQVQYVTSTEACMFHPDLGYVGAGMPTTELEAKEFAANVADPTRHLKS